MRYLLPILLLVPILSFAQSDDECVPKDSWLFPATEDVGSSVFDHFTDAQGLLLGETHDNPYDHEWQLKMLKEAHQQHGDHTVLVVEMLPTDVQTVLDAWVLDAISTEQMLADTHWNEYWTFDFNMYKPIFMFAKENKIRIIAGNTTNEFREKVKQVGWDGLSKDDYKYAPIPAGPSPMYVQFLVMLMQESHHSGGDVTKERLVQFVGNQQLWDVRMAKSVAEQINMGYFPVMLVGYGHLQYGWGIPHQLEKLYGVHNVVTSMAWYNNVYDCAGLTPEFMNALFGITLSE